LALEEKIMRISYQYPAEMKGKIGNWGLFALLCFLSISRPLTAQLIPNLGGTRAGTSAMTALKLDVSPKVAALGGAGNSLPGDGYAGQWNVAGLADLENTTFNVSNAFYVAGLNHSYFSAVLPHARVGNFAVSAMSLTTGAMEKRTEFQPLGTGEYFYAANTAVGLSYAKLLTTRFSFGATAKFVNEMLDNYNANSVLVDMGFLYRLEFKDIRFAVNIQNFGPNSRISGTKPLSPINDNSVRLDAFPAPAMFSMGFSMVPWKDTTQKNQLMVIGQVNHPNDNAANVRLGAEFTFRNLLFLRAGYKLNVTDNIYPTLGVGVRTRLGRHPILLDYAIDPIQHLGWINRVGLQFSITKREKR
jgi:hypothetical protein